MMLDLDNFNGLWVVCEANYVTDPDPNSFCRSMMHLFGVQVGREDYEEVPTVFHQSAAG